MKSLRDKRFRGNKFLSAGAYLLIVLSIITLSSCAHYESANVETDKPLPSEYTPKTEMPVLVDPINLTKSVNGLAKDSDEPVRLDLKSATIMALKNSVSFRVDRYDPKITKTGEEIERAVFDPVFSAGASFGQRHDDSNTGGYETSNSLDAEASIKKSLPTGTTLEVGVTEAYDYDKISGASDHSDSTDLDITFTQALLSGKGTDVNLARLRQAKLDTIMSEYELQGAAETLVAQTEQAYWDYILAERSIEIYEKSVELANQQVAEVEERIRVGKLPETELVAAQAEIASRREQLIDAKGTFAKRRLTLIRLLNLTDEDSKWDKNVELTDPPELPEVKLDSLDAHLMVALKKRPDLNQARLQINRNDLELVHTKNGLLPKLDLFVQLGGSRYANSFAGDADQDGEEVSYTVGLDFEIPLGKREANAKHVRAILSKERAAAALENMEQLVQVDIRSAYIDVDSTRERVKATKATRELREKTLDTEQEKFRVGRSTAFLVSQARRDMVTSQIKEIEAIIGYRKALLELYRLEGSLLARWGIAQ
jgi:outer membrane protein TolC